MRSFDDKKLEQTAVLENFQQAVKDGNEEKAAEAIAQYFENLEAGIKQEYALAQYNQDKQILAGRGLRQLTSEETKYYNAVLTAMGTNNPQQALTNLDKTMPRTVIDEVFDNIVADHPLLEKINFYNTTGLTEFVVNRGSKQLAAWGKLCDDIVKELSGNLEVVPMTFNKLCAFIPVCKSMLTLGAEWLDRYIRSILYDALAFGLEEGIINGTGVDQPIGMNRDLKEPKSDGDPYVEKKAVKVTNFSIAELGKILGEIAKDEEGNSRKLRDLILVVNPSDYYSLVAPATQVLTQAGYISTLPFPIEIIESEQIATGKAILGRAEGYFMGLGMAKEGKIEYSDEYKFLEDERTYLIKLLGNGFPKDNTSFTLLDISAVKPVAPAVRTIADVPSV